MKSMNAPGSGLTRRGTSRSAVNHEGVVARGPGVAVREDGVLRPYRDHVVDAEALGLRVIELLTQRDQDIRRTCSRKDATSLPP